MVRLLSFLKFFVPVTLVLLLFFQPGSCREFIMRSSKGADRFATTDSHQESRVTMELDYEDAGPNTNKRSGLPQPLPSPDSPAPVEG